MTTTAVDTPAAPAPAMPEPPKALLKALLDVLKDVEYVRPTEEGRDQDEVYRVLRDSLQARGVLFAPSAVGTVVDPTTSLVSVQCRLSFVHVRTGQSVTYDWPGGSANMAEAGQVTRALTGAVISFLKTMFLLRQGAGTATEPPGELRRRTPVNDRTATPEQRNLIRAKQKQNRVSDLGLLWMIAETEGSDLPVNDLSLDDAQLETESRLNLLHARDVDGVLRKLNAYRVRRRT